MFSGWESVEDLDDPENSTKLAEIDPRYLKAIKFCESVFDNVTTFGDVTRAIAKFLENE